MIRFPGEIMSISGLVITLSDEAERAERARAALLSDSRLELGPSVGDRLAAVADTPSPREDRLLWEALQSLDGIQRVDVIYVGLDPQPRPETLSQNGRGPEESNP